MSKIYESILELVGHTPIVHLNRIEKNENTLASIYAKVEFFNPAGSVKDRIALNMINEAENAGLIKPGSTIIEGTSGNTGIGLSAVAAAKGYKAIICMPENMSKERIALMRAYGSEVILTPKELSMGGSGAKAKELAESIPNSFIPGQGGNPNNPGAHYKSTGPEIWEDMDGDVDIFVSAVGTGGTVTGTGHYLKEKNPNIEIYGVEPEKCPVLNGGPAGLHKIQGIGGGIICPVTDMSIFKEVLLCSDENAYKYSRLVGKKEGFLIGISAGCALWAAVEIAKRPENKGKKIVVIFPDGGDHYLSGDLYE